MSKATCQHCSSKLYRSAQAGTRVKKDAPRTVCRNEACPGKVQKLERPARRRRVSQIVKPKEKAPDVKGELERHRETVRQYLAVATQGKDTTAVAMILALVCEETGNPEAAAVLAAKHRLSTLGYTVS